jgi:cytochrome c peroxidase
MDRFTCFLFFVSILLFSCGKKNNTAGHGFFQQQVPSTAKDSFFLFSQNEFTKEKATLGRYLFYDNRLSINNTKACASCHDPKFSFTDNYRKSIGAYGDLTTHNSPPLINLIFNQFLTAADSSFHFPEQQVQNPMFRKNPIELGWKGNEENMLGRFRADSFYTQQFQTAFPGEMNPVTIKNIQYAITSFIKTIISFQSPYDDYQHRNKKDALPSSAINGLQLFQSAQLQCNRCHGGINFNQPGFQSAPYFNTGFFTDTLLHKGLAVVTANKNDGGKYKVPTLRNLAFTAPYLHDGSAETLEDVIRLYEQGGYPSVQNKHPFITGFKLNSQQRSDLISFLLSLSDSSVLTNPAYTNPWTVK